MQEKLEKLKRGELDDAEIEQTKKKFDAKKAYKEKLKQMEEDERHRKLLLGRDGKNHNNFFLLEFLNRNFPPKF